MSTIHLPNEASNILELAFGPNLDRAALEALAIEGYRATKLSAGEVARVLGLETSLVAQAWLAAHGVEENYSIEDLRADRENLWKLPAGGAQSATARVWQRQNPEARRGW